MGKNFIGYIGDSDIHDGVITRFEHNNEEVTVTIKSSEGRMIIVQFDGVKSIKSNKPEGMMLYALSEMKHPKNRLFVFVNGEEEDDACLEITAEGYQIENV